MGRGETGNSDPRSRGCCQQHTRFKRLQCPHTSRVPSHRFRLSQSLDSKSALGVVQLTHLRRHVKQPILLRLLVGRSCDWVRANSIAIGVETISSIVFDAGWHGEVVSRPIKSLRACSRRRLYILPSRQTTTSTSYHLQEALRGVSSRS